MSAKGSCCGCDPCGVRIDSCEGMAKCVRCLPRYVCVDVLPLGSEYEAACIQQFSMRLASESCGIYSGTHSSGFSFTASVYSVDDGYGNVTCYTEIPSDDGVVTAEGVFESELESVISYDGNTYQVTLKGKTGVPNPLIDAACGQCRCASCLPSKICVTMSLPGETVMGGFPCNPCLLATSLAFDCETLQWTGPDMTCGSDVYTVVASLNQACQIVISVSGGQYEVSDIVVNIDGSPRDCGEGTVVDAFLCIEDDVWVTTRKNKSSPNCAGETEYSILFSSSYSLVDEYGALVGAISMKADYCNSPCNSSSDDACPQACPMFNERELMCSPLTLYASFVDDGGCDYSPGSVSLKQVGTATIPLSFPNGSCQRYGSESFSFGCDAGNGYTGAIAFWYQPQDGCPSGEVDMRNYRLRIQIGGVPCDSFGQAGVDVTVAPYAYGSCDGAPTVDFEVPLLGQCYGLVCCESNVPSPLIMRVSL